MSPREVFPLIGLYVAYGIYVTYIASMKLVGWQSPAVLLLLTPLSYWVFSWAGSIARDQAPMYLESAWQMMEEARSRQRHAEPSNKAGIRLKEIYRNRTGQSTPQVYSPNSSMDAWQSYKESAYEEDEDCDEETFTFVPKNEPKTGGHSFIIDNINTPLEYVWEKICYPWEILFGLVLPHNKYPGVAFLLIIACCFIISDVQLMLADKIIDKLAIDPNFVALTVYNFFSNMPDLLTVITAAKNKEFTLALTTIFSSQVINLQISLCLPWFLRELIVGGPRTDNSKSMAESMAIAIGVLCMLLVVMSLNRFRLTNLMGIVLVLTYFGYIGLEWQLRHKPL